MSEVWLRVLAIIIGSGGFTTGLWTYIRSRDNTRKAKDRLTMGLAQAQIIALGLEYIKRGSVTYDEYENLYKYLYLPYKELNGNGSAERVMLRVQNLPFQPRQDHSDIFRNPEQRWDNNVRIASGVNNRQEASSE